jgi:YbbR domain-containing protein
MPPQGTLLLQAGQTVTVTISLTALTVSQTVHVPPSVVNLAPGVQVAKQPPQVAVTIAGPAPALSTLALNPNDFRVVVDAAGRGPGGYDLDAKVQNAPNGLTVQGIDPARVHVDLQAVPTPTPAPAPPSGP